jgi:hypothetical protein
MSLGRGYSRKLSQHFTAAATAVDATTFLFTTAATFNGLLMLFQLCIIV